MRTGAAVFSKRRGVCGALGRSKQNGLYVVRLKMPAGYKIPAHNHPTTENVTVVSGNFHIGMGDYLVEKKGIELTSRGYGETPANMNHYA